MDTKHLSKFVKKYKPFVLLVTFILGIGILMLLLKLLSSTNTAPNITKDQILIEKGGTTITVNKNGLIEYKSGNDVFYQNWDANRVSLFFSNMQARARESLKNGSSEACSGCYKVTLYLDGKLVTFYVASDDEIILDIIDDFGGGGSGGNLSDYFNDQNTPTPTSGVGGGTNPTPTSSAGSGGGSDPVPTSIYNPQDNYPTVAAGCEAWAGQIAGGKAIISNTYCVISPTPTP